MKTLLNAALLISIVSVAAFCQAPVVGQGGVVNGASFSLDQPDKRVAPGSLISIFGTSLAAGTALADSIPISTSLSDVTSVTFNGVKAPILATGTGQINVQLPWELTPPTSGTANVAVIVTRKSAGASAPVQTPIGQYSPGIFTAKASGSGQALALLPKKNNAIAGPAGSIPGRLTQPAVPGDVLEVFATGLGPVMQPPGDGSPGNAQKTVITPVVTFGGIQGDVEFSGLAPGFVGLYQVNVKVPTNAPTGNAVPIQIEMGGVTSTKQAVIAIAAQ